MNICIYIYKGNRALMLDRKKGSAQNIHLYEALLQLNASRLFAIIINFCSSLCKRMQFISRKRRPNNLLILTYVLRIHKNCQFILSTEKQLIF